LDTVADFLLADAEILSQLCDGGIVLRQELVERRVEQANGHRQTAHLLKDLVEVAALERQQLRQSLAPTLLVVGQDHLAYGTDAVVGKEHVLGPAQADAFGAELPRRPEERRVGKGAGMRRRTGR